MIIERRNLECLKELLFWDIKSNVDIEFIVILDFKERLVNTVLTNVIVKFKVYWVEFKIFKEFFCINSFIFIMKDKV